MNTINVVLDTSIYRKNPGRDDLPFQALARLSKAGVIYLHLPHIVVREFQTQQRSLYARDFDDASKALSAVLRKSVPTPLRNEISKLKDQLDSERNAVLASAEDALVQWATSLGATMHDITQAQASGALEAYFSGGAPLIEPKNRNDIPDAFIYQAVKDLSGQSVPLAVVVEDGRLADASSLLANTLVFRSLAAFIESDPVQAHLLDLDEAEKFDETRSALRAWEEDTRNLSSFLGDQVPARTVYETIKARSIPDDNNEATVTGFGDARDVEIYWTELSYFGSDDYGVPFHVDCFVYGTFYVYKADYFAGDYKFGVSDHNDYYFEAEREFFIRVTGLARLKMGREKLASLLIGDMGVEIDISIDPIDGIEVLGDEDL